MKINLNTRVGFKGYDAVPLKTLHTSTRFPNIIDEFSKIAQKEGFELKPSRLNGSFCQDDTFISNTAKGSKAIIAANIPLFEQHKKEARDNFQMPIELHEFFGSDEFISGGNFFIGKKPNGEKWMMIGNMEILSKDPKAISKLYDVPEKNIYFIAQQDYHLDMSIRPIGYPYVLVNNPLHSAKTEAKIKGGEVPPVDEGARQVYQKELDQLRSFGFYPILITGVYSEGKNFLNAIVNTHPDGTFSYITNSSKSLDSRDEEFQKLFERDLRTKLEKLAKTDKQAPKLRDIYFVEGELYDRGNEMTENLLEGAGGVHCMTIEEPDFDRWM